MTEEQREKRREKQRVYNRLPETRKRKNIRRRTPAHRAKMRVYMSQPHMVAKKKSWDYRYFFKKLNMTLEEGHARQQAQNNLCKFCNLLMDENDRALMPVPDHCHETMVFRGWVHQACNVIIGRLEKSGFEKAIKIADYLNKFNPEFEIIIKKVRKNASNGTNTTPPEGVG
jgi:hypothetical protein